MSDTENNVYLNKQKQPLDALTTNASMIAGISTLLSNMDDNASISKTELAGIATLLKSAAQSVSEATGQLNKDFYNRSATFNHLLSKETIQFRALCCTQYGQTLMSFIRLVHYNSRQETEHRVSLGQLFSQFASGEEADDEVENFEQALDESLDETSLSIAN
jgi:hypothetical protein